MSIPIDKQNIIAILGIQSLPDEQKMQIIDQASDLVQKRLLLRILESLPSNKQTEFEQLLDTGTPDTINEFLAVNVLNMQEMMFEEVNKVKQDLGQYIANLDTKVSS